MAEPSPPPPSNAGLRILLSKDRPAPASSFTAFSSHADRDRIIGYLSSQSESTEGDAVNFVNTVTGIMLGPSMFSQQVISVCSFYREYSEMHYLALNPQKHLLFRGFRKQLNLRCRIYFQAIIATFDLMMSIVLLRFMKETVLVLEENQSLENALRTLLQELISSAVQSGKKIMQYGNSMDSGESNCLITRLLG
ncbi:hypothetical protein PR202_gb18320 [Eleusine coracana subsp. coracana]|uniref:Uncharacterized protein n=1 Tax=Eleusine coracana subsp. coracana TaxID=191504 RepID=A0AAV5F738_ELECO|nr:hypothetical protein PR202_gb18320 [Eleusine coracana subsp. coracana]